MPCCILSNYPFKEDDNANLPRSSNVTPRYSRSSGSDHRDPQPGYHSNGKLRFGCARAVTSRPDIEQSPRTCAHGEMTYRPSIRIDLCVKRTCRFSLQMSAYDPKRTLPSSSNIPV